MGRRFLSIIYLMAASVIFIGCGDSSNRSGKRSADDTTMTMQDRVDQYTTVELSADLSDLTDNQKKIISLLIDASEAMDEVFWKEAYAQKEQLMNGIADGATQKYAQINYGPWDRLHNNNPFIDSIGSKPEGANFYPADMTRQEFENWDSETKDDLYTLVRRDDVGNLMTIPYHKAFSEQHELAAAKLEEAATLAEDEGLQNYLNLRAEALLTGEYQPSDLAWLDMKDNVIDVVIGPIENYEDKLYGYKAAHEAFILIKDQEWSQRLSKYAAVLPELQRGLPVTDKYKQEEPGRDSDLNAYDAVYYAGDANAGSKTIAINLPNDEEVQLKKGTRRLQLKNTIRAKYDKILVPIAKVLLVQNQQQYLTFNAFFSNTMFHEVAHGLGIKNTITGKGTVRASLKDYASALEEGKADVLGLYMIRSLRNDGVLTQGNIRNNYTTFVASIFRSIRFGSGDAHGLANLIRFNFFKEKGVITYNSDSKKYAVNFDNIEEATDSLSQKILQFQGDGDYQGVDAFIKKYSSVNKQLQASLNRLDEQNIPRDIIFEQGKQVLGII